MAYGTYSGQINVISDSGGATILVTVVANPDTDLDYEPKDTFRNAIEIGTGDSYDFFLELINNGTIRLDDLQLDDSGQINDWIEFSRQGFSVIQGGIEEIQGTISVPAGTSAGLYVGTITVIGTSDTGSKSITIPLTVSVEKAAFTIDPNEISISVLPSQGGSTTITLTNLANATTIEKVNLWTQGVIEDWLEFDVNDFDLSPRTSKDVVITIGNIPEDMILGVEHSGEIVVTSETGGFSVIPVKIRLVASTEFFVVPTSMDLTLYKGYTARKTLTIGSDSSKTVQVSAGGDLADSFVLDDTEVLLDNDAKELSFNISISGTTGDGTYSSELLLNADGAVLTVPIGITVTSDTTPPVISGRSPKPNTSALNTTTIGATFTDQTGVDTSTVVLKVDDQTVTPTYLTEDLVSYASSEGLSFGMHNVSLSVKDVMGYQNESSWSFTVVDDETLRKLLEQLISSMFGDNDGDNQISTTEFLDMAGKWDPGATDSVQGESYGTADLLTALANWNPLA